MRDLLDAITRMQTAAAQTPSVAGGTTVAAQYQQTRGQAAQRRRARCAISSRALRPVRRGPEGGSLAGSIGCASSESFADLQQPTAGQAARFKQLTTDAAE
jgi:hypothetical protein